MIIREQTEKEILNEEKEILTVYPRSPAAHINSILDVYLRRTRFDPRSNDQLSRMYIKNFWMFLWNIKH